MGQSLKRLNLHITTQPDNSAEKTYNAHLQPTAVDATLNEWWWKTCTRKWPDGKMPKLWPLPKIVVIKGALYIIWCGVNRLGDSGVKVVWIDSAILQLLLSRRVSYCLPGGVRPECIYRRHSIWILYSAPLRCLSLEDQFHEWWNGVV